jgi:hypothetical protein
MKEISKKKISILMEAEEVMMKLWLEELLQMLDLLTN